MTETVGSYQAVTYGLTRLPSMGTGWKYKHTNVAIPPYVLHIMLSSHGGQLLLHILIAMVRCSRLNVDQVLLLSAL
jgi:hypothetical protein